MLGNESTDDLLVSNTLFGCRENRIKHTDLKIQNSKTFHSLRLREG